jgi:hypothetical protein
VDDLRQRVAGKYAHDNVHMVGHDAPGEEPITLVVKVAQSVGYDPSNGRKPEMAVSCAVIQVLLDHLRRELLDLFSFTRAYLTVKLLCGLDYAFRSDSMRSKTSLGRESCSLNVMK